MNQITRRKPLNLFPPYSLQGSPGSGSRGFIQGNMTEAQFNQIKPWPLSQLSLMPYIRFLKSPALIEQMKTERALLVQSWRQKRNAKPMPKKNRFKRCGFKQRRVCGESY